MNLTTYQFLRPMKKRRHSGMDYRNPGHRDVIGAAILGFWIPAFPTGAMRVGQISSPRRMGRAQRNPSLDHGYRGQDLWFFGKSSLSEMTIEGIRRADPKPLH